MTKPIRQLSNCLALVLFITIIGGCVKSTREQATGKGAVRGINSIVDAPELLFLIEERSTGIVGFKESTGLDRFDDLTFNFSFDLVRPGIVDPERVATEVVKVIADTDHTLILTGSVANPAIIQWTDPQRVWAGTETVLEVIFTHLSPALGEVDVFFAAPGTAPVPGGAIGSLVNGERLPITEFAEGVYEIILTPPGDPATILYISALITLGPQNRIVFAIFDPDPTIPGPISVNLIGENGASTNLADPNFPSRLRLVHGSFGTENVDGYYNLDFNNLKFPDIAHTEVSAYADVDNGLTSINLTPVGNPGADILTSDLITVPGTIRTIILSGQPGNLFFNALLEDARPVSTSPLIRIANFAVNYPVVDVYLDDPDTDVNDVLPRFPGLPTQLDTNFGAVRDGMRQLVLTEFLGKNTISSPIMLDLSIGDVVSIGIFDTVDPLVLQVIVYDVQ